MTFAIALMYPILLGHIAVHAVKKMIFDSYVSEVQGKVEIEDGNYQGNVQQLGDAGN